MEKITRSVFSWLEDAKTQLLENMKSPLEIDTKSAYNDLVTNLDKQTQEILIQHIQKDFPNDQILGEEDGRNQIDSIKGRVWIIDPIDGTLNFVLQQKNFCIMLGLVENGKPLLGFIYDVMNDELYWGGPGLGVYCNQKPLPKPKDLALNEGLIGMNAYMYKENIQHTFDISKETMGVRMIGCAGLEMIHILKGEISGYISYLQPWDYAAGCALLEAFSIPYSNLSGEKVDFMKKEFFVALQPTAYQEVATNYFSSK